MNKALTPKFDLNPAEIRALAALYVIPGKHYVRRNRVDAYHIDVDALTRAGHLVNTYEEFFCLHPATRWRVADYSPEPTNVQLDLFPETLEQTQ